MLDPLIRYFKHRKTTDSNPLRACKPSSGYRWSVCPFLLFIFFISPPAFADSGRAELINLLHSDTDTGRAKLNELRKRLSFKVSDRLQLDNSNAYCPFTNCFSDLYAGDADVIFFVNSDLVNRDRATTVGEFGIGKNSLTVYVRNGEEVRVQTLKDLEGKVVGVIAGQSYGMQFNFNHKIVKYEVNQIQQLIKMLLTHRVDAFVGFLTGNQFLEDYPEISPVEVPYPQRKYSIAVVSKASPHYDLLSQRLPELINEWTLDGFFETNCREVGVNCPDPYEALNLERP